MKDILGATPLSEATANRRPGPAPSLRTNTSGRIAPQSGAAFTLHKGQVLRVVDPLGEQVADLFAFEKGNLARWLSSCRSIDYASKTRLSTGDTLYSNDSRPMFTILGDTVGRHDFLLTPCSQEMFEILYGCQHHHPSCFENLATSLAPFGVQPGQIHTTFNIFMEVNVDRAGVVTVGVPRSKAGDWIELRAEMDLICGLTACAAVGSNNGSFKPIDYVICEVAGCESSARSEAAFEQLPVRSRQACNGGRTVVPLTEAQRLQHAPRIALRGSIHDHRSQRRRFRGRACVGPFTDAQAGLPHHLRQAASPVRPRRRDAQPR